MKISVCWKELLAFLLLAAIVGTEMIYRQPFYNYSLEFIPHWQDNANSVTVNFFKFVSHFGSQEIQAALIILVYALGPRRLLLKFMATLFTAQVGSSFLKLLYHNPRPFYSSDEVAAMTCSQGYGNPSGHCLVTFAVYGTLWVLLFSGKYEHFVSPFSQRWMYEAAKWFSLVILACVCVLTFFARLYLGAHSLNQTVYGTLLGLWMVYTFGLVLPKHIDEHYEEFLKEGRVWAGCNAGFLFAVIGFLVLEAVNVVLYYTLKESNSHMNEAWIKRIKLKCPKLSLVPIENSFKGILHASLYAFIYFCQIFNARKFPKAFNYWYSEIGIPKLLLRTIIMVALIALCFIPYFVTLNSSVEIKMWVGLFLTNVLVALIAVPLVDWMAEKLKLIVMGPREEKYTSKESNASV